MNPGYIKTIYSNYLAVRDSLRVTQRSIEKDLYILHNRTIFQNSDQDDMRQVLRSAGKELEDLIVLSLFASFERQIRDQILDKSSKLQEVIPVELGKKITELARREMERWRISEVIDLFDFAVDGTVRGKLKQILQYRNWIAHGRNPSELPPVLSTSPKVAYETILEFVSQVQDYQPKSTQ